MHATARTLPSLSFLLLLLLAGGVACAKPARAPVAPASPAEPAAGTRPHDQAPSCAAVAAHALRILLDSDEMRTATPEERALATPRIEDLEPEIVAECTDKQWDARTRRCVLAATRVDELQKCERSPGGAPAADGEAQPKDLPPPPDVAAPPAGAERTASGLASRLLQKGTGTARPRHQDQVRVHYTGWTTDGKMFDSSLVRGEPSTFPLRAVIAGWTEGLQLMTVGEKRRFWIPEGLAYQGKQGPPSGMLVFDVELLEIIRGPEPLPAPADVGAAPADAKKEKDGVAWKTTRKGAGKRGPSAAAFVEIHFTVWTTEGLMQQSSHETGRPVKLYIDSGVPAWKQMLPRMLPGEKRLIWAPAELAFTDSGLGSRGERPVVFEIELISFVEPPKVPTDVARPPRNAVRTASGLHSRVLQKGTGTEHPTREDAVKVHYSGWTTDGKLFDSSVVRGQPVRFVLSAVIPGWTEGLQLMIVGEKRRFWIPEELAYQGKQGPPSGMLVFDVELLAINPTSDAGGDAGK